ncbi:MAG: prolyl oligopeptidase family serine peptidase [Bryobacteraceae bacterium]|nr:prolyl oligopeptidase family serine peptidase [Bryobacteraceae bacterium]
MSQNMKPAAAGLPPLIDRQLLFGNPDITSAELSPDGKFIAFLKPWNGTINIWVKKTEEPFSAARLLTTENKRPIPAYFWSRDSKQILFIKDKDGDENFNVFAVDPAAKNADGTEAPPMRDLTGLKGIQVRIYSAPKQDPDILYIGLNDRDKSWHDLYKLKLSSGERTLVRKNTDKIAAWFFDNKGQLRLALTVKDNGDQQILRVDADKFTAIYTCSVFEACGPERFHKDGKRVYMETNKGDADLISLFLFDPETQKLEPVESDPLKRVDLGGTMFSEVTDELVMTRYVDDKPRRYFREKGLEADYKFLQSKFPGREIGIGSRTLDEQTMLITAASDVEPGEVYLFERRGRKLTLQYKVREKVMREALSSVRPIRYKSSDGLEIPAFLTVPKGLPEKNLPIVVVPHGGPWARDNWGYSGFTQFFANRGYAVLQPNFRGSTGYGKKFLNAGNGEWGRKMQDDITWGVKHLIAEGIADPKRVGILGGSYGGYATLAGVAFTPDLYRAAIDIVGPSNLVTLLEAIPPYWEAGRKIMYARMADLSTSEGKAWLTERSPLHAATKIKTPLMVVQGANDPRVNKGEAEQIVVALRDRGFAVEYLLADDEGHGFARPVNNMAMLMAAEKFLAKHLDGRYQEGAPADVGQRLKEITVDPKTVVLAKKADPGSVGAPKLVSDLSPGTWNYSAKISAGGREIPLKVTTTVKEENGHWVASDSMETPMGPATDTAQLEKGTLVLQKRSVNQGPVNIEMNIEGNKGTGKMSVNGKDQEISVDLGGPLFGDSGGAWQAISRLPLAEGYTTTFRNFDLQRQKVKLTELKVDGTEKVTVPAGTFDAWRVQLTSADGGADKSTLWVSKNDLRPLKISSVLASMGGAIMTAELLP